LKWPSPGWVVNSTRMVSLRTARERADNGPLGAIEDTSRVDGRASTSVDVEALLLAVAGSA
jgi:hypothetical protein